MSVWPKTVTSYQTSDNQLHPTESSARWWQSRLEGAALATRMLEEGRSLGASLREGGFLPADICPSLDEVFTTTKLVISHWQCRDEPGYAPAYITPDGGIFVHGHAGSWSGPYGANCSATEVERYWLDTKNRAERQACRG